LKTLIYLSHPNFETGVEVDANQVLKDIYRTALARNVDLGICGVLLFTGGAFLQVMEAPRKASIS
jgi:hypothetical protein